MSDQMIDEDRRILTEFLGECWHVSEVTYFEEGKTSPYLPGKYPLYTCTKCGRVSSKYWRENADGNTNRTFNTWEDFGALKDRIVEKAKMPEFIRYVVLGSRDLSVIRAMVWWERKHPLERCLLVLEALKQGALK